MDAKIIKLEEIEKRYLEIGNELSTDEVASDIKRFTKLSKEHFWNDVPGFAVEIDFSIIENSEAFIKTYENLL